MHLDLRISLQISKIIEMMLMITQGLGEDDLGKNPEAKYLMTLSFQDY
jgi:hypothetical protein